MLRSLKKAAQTLERSMEEAFSTAPSSRTSFVNTTLTISGHKLRLGPVFAEGGFSFIHVATPVNPPSATRYAVKRLPCPDPDAEAAARREAAFLRRLPPHPNIVAFHGAAFRDAHAFLMFDLVDGGTLPDVLRRSAPNCPPTKLLAIFADAVAAVVHLHAQDPPVAVRDVKLENILFDRLDARYKLCDFGSACPVARRFVSRTDILRAQDDVANSCSAMYRAPEIADLYRRIFVCERVDVWALGCVWHAMLFGNLPFDGMSSLQILKGLTTVPDHPAYPPEYIKLLEAMLTVSPAERVDSFTVLERVRRLQGQEIDRELSAIGRRLREQRARDFAGDDAAAPAKCGTDLVSFETTQLQTPASALRTASATTLSTAPSGNGAAFAQPRGSLIDFQPGETEEERVAASFRSEQEGGWADFDSAFGVGAPAVTALPVPVSSGSLPSVGKPPGGSRTNEREIGSNGMVQSFFESSDPSKVHTSLHVSPSSQNSVPSARNRTRHPQDEGASISLIDFSDLQMAPSRSAATSGPAKTSTAPRRTAARSAPDFSDLIDFGPGG